MGGFFLVLEGPEGAGKSTLAATLTARARSTGSTVLAVRNRVGRRRPRRPCVVLDHSHAAGPEAELLLMLAARADLVRKVIRPALEAGSLVIADRFDLSTQAYQVAGAACRLTWSLRQTGLPPGAGRPHPGARRDAGGRTREAGQAGRRATGWKQREPTFTPAWPLRIWRRPDRVCNI
jgi:thymidylate kinase